MSNTALRIAEFVQWVLAVSLALLVGLATLSFIFGDGLVTLKFALFVVGFLLFGIGSLAISAEHKRRPNPEHRLLDFSLESDREYGFETRLQDLPPMRGQWIPLQDRVSRNVKIFTTSLVLLVISYAMEAVFGIVA